MFQIILGFVIITMLISLYATYQSAAKPNKNILLGINLLNEHSKCAEVIEIITKYKEVNQVLLVIFSITSVPVFFIPYQSIIIGYLTIWFILYMALCNHYIQYYNRRLLLIKSRNLWFNSDGSYHILDDNKLIEWFIKHRLITDDKEQIYIDDDKYWMKSSYSNPTDKRIMVEKRIGMGITLNTASKGGKAFIIGISTFTILMLAGIIYLFVRMDFATFNLTVNEGIVSIEAPFYSYQFQTDEIEDIILIDTMPKKGTRTNGAATDLYLLGNFNFSGYGKAKVYVYKDYTPNIMIKLKDLTVFFNTKSEEKTKEYYEILRKESKLY